MIKIKSFLYLFFCMSALTGSVFAAETGNETGTLKPNLQAGKKTYELCATCHYANGWGKEDGSFPVIAGQHASVIKKQLADFRHRDRENPTMFPFTDNETLGGAQGIEDVTAYIAQLPVNPSPGKGDGKKLEQGKKLFAEKCAVCHGAQAEGNEAAIFPRLQGQHYGYLLRQLKWIRDGLRKNANAGMLEQIKGMDDETLASIADYISTIEVVAPVSETVKSSGADGVSTPDTEKKVEAATEEEPDCD